MGAPDKQPYDARFVDRSQFYSLNPSWAGLRRATSVIQIGANRITNMKRKVNISGYITLERYA